MEAVVTERDGCVKVVLGRGETRRLSITYGPNPMRPHLSHRLIDWETNKNLSRSQTRLSAKARLADNASHFVRPNENSAYHMRARSCSLSRNCMRSDRAEQNIQHGDEVWESVVRFCVGSGRGLG